MAAFRGIAKHRFGHEDREIRRATSSGRAALLPRSRTAEESQFQEGLRISGKYKFDREYQINFRTPDECNAE
jgi:hypothetical protein